MSYFNKKSKHEPSFSNQFDESSLSAEDCLIVNSNIFNKSQVSSQNSKLSHSQNNPHSQNHPKTTSTTSYLKNFKKHYHKNNQENIFSGQIPRQDSSFNKPSNMKQDYEKMMNELMGGQVLHENNHSSSSRLSNQPQKSSKSKLASNEDKKSYRNHTENSLANHLFLNDQSEQSMQELLNSSINQFERFLEQEHQIPEKYTNQKSQNINLKKTLTKFKSILKQKLQSGLNKQKQQMKSMLNEYVELITKLLHDKEELSNHIEELEEQLSSKANDITHLQRKVQEINKEKDDHIQKTKNQIQEFLNVIEQFQSQTRQENERQQQMERQIQRLRHFEEQSKSLHLRSMSNHKKYSSQEFQEQEKRIQCQSQKIQTLLQLLEKSQHETNTLKEILAKQNSQISLLRKDIAQKADSLKSQSKSSQGQSYQYTQQEMDEVKALYQHKIEELQIEHEEEFIQYEKAIKETLTKKDQCIQRLNFIISELREGKKSAGRSRSIDDCRKREANQANGLKFVQKQKRQSFDQEANSMHDNTFNQEEPIEQEQSIRQ